MRSDFRNLRSWSLILNSGLVERVVTREVLSEDFSPCLLTPMVASRTRNMSYPPSLMRETTSAICSESERDSLIASPSSFIKSFSCWSTCPPWWRLFAVVTASPAIRTIQQKHITRESRERPSTPLARGWCHQSPYCARSRAPPSGRRDRLGRSLPDGRKRLAWDRNIGEKTRPFRGEKTDTGTRTSHASK